MESFIPNLVVFVLAIFLGIELITKVPSTLHTPLMSGSNAISGITIVGALLCSFNDSFGSLGVILGFFAVLTVARPREGQGPRAKNRGEDVKSVAIIRWFFDVDSIHSTQPNTPATPQTTIPQPLSLIPVSCALSPDP